MLDNQITISRVKLAENLVEGIQYLSRRDVLAEVSTGNSLLSLSCKEARYKNSSIEWMKIEQVGICHDYSKHQYFSLFRRNTVGSQNIRVRS